MFAFSLNGSLIDQVHYTNREHIFIAVKYLGDVLFGDRVSRDRSAKAAVLPYENDIIAYRFEQLE